jgi:hypothetical protein
VPLSLFGFLTLSFLNSTGTRVEPEILIPKKVCFVENGGVVVLIVIVNNPHNVVCFNRGAGC